MGEEVKSKTIPFTYVIILKSAEQIIKLNKDV